VLWSLAKRNSMEDLEISPEQPRCQEASQLRGLQAPFNNLDEKPKRNFQAPTTTGHHQLNQDKDEQLQQEPQEQHARLSSNHSGDGGPRPKTGRPPAVSRNASRLRQPSNILQLLNELGDGLESQAEGNELNKTSQGTHATGSADVLICGEGEEDGEEATQEDFTEADFHLSR
jgi:hypothetical protein